MNIAKILTCLFVSSSLVACGGGGSDSGGPDIPPLPNLGSIPGARVGSEFVASRCIDSSVGLEGTTIINSCDEGVNVREISGNQFGPVFLIPANSTRVVPGAQVPLSACFAPRVPGGVADLLRYQCLI